MWLLHTHDFLILGLPKWIHFSMPVPTQSKNNLLHRTSKISHVSLCLSICLSFNPYFTQLLILSIFSTWKAYCLKRDNSTSFSMFENHYDFKTPGKLWPKSIIDITNLDNMPAVDTRRMYNTWQSATVWLISAILDFQHGLEPVNSAKKLFVPLKWSWEIANICPQWTNCAFLLPRKKKHFQRLQNVPTTKDIVEY